MFSATGMGYFYAIISYQYNLQYASLSENYEMALFKTNDQLGRDEKEQQVPNQTKIFPRYKNITPKVIIQKKQIIFRWEL